MNGATRIFLVLLRIAIGWHFFFEGLEKIRSVDWIGPTASNRPWTSRDYLRAANGPLGDWFHHQAGDLDEMTLAYLEVQPLPAGIDSSRVPPRERIPPALDRAWNEYFDHFVNTYKLNEEQTTKARAKLDQAKDYAVRWMLGEDKNAVREVAGPIGSVKESPPERIAAYRKDMAELRSIMQNKLPAFGKDVEKQRLVVLRGECNRLRTELLADLNGPMQDSLPSILDAPPKHPLSVDFEEPKLWLGLTRMEWIDAVTRYGLTLVGACLLLGLFTRAACLGGVAFLILFYLAMPALPWLPESPRSEGHYLFINKNIIEMLALLTLATTRSGLWVGLDGLIHVLLPWNWKSKAHAA